MEQEFKRLQIYKYTKSNRLSAISRHQGYNFIIFDVSQDLTQILKIRQVQRVQSRMMESTQYYLEVVYGINSSGSIKCRFVRVISEDDVAIEKWDSKKELSSLPVFPESYITDEEYYWAGRREGNIGGGIALAIIALASLGLFYSLLGTSLWAWFFAFAGGLVAWQALIYKWKNPEKEKQDRVDKLLEFKRKIQVNSDLHKKIIMKS